LNIAIDISHLPPLDHQVGIHIYTIRLLHALVNLNSGHRFTIFHSTLMQPFWFDQFMRPNGNIRFRRYPLPHRLVRWLWQNTLLPVAETLMGGPDAIHMMCEPDLIRSRRAKLVVTLQDAITIRFPQFNLPHDVARLERTIKTVCLRADAIIASSFNTRNDLIELCSAPADRIHVVHLAGDPDFKVLEEEEIRKTTTRYDLQDSPYFVFVSTIEIRKNVKRLVEAFNEIKGTLLEPYKLVLVGKKGWLSDDVYHRISQLPCAKDILLLGRLDRRELIALVNGARAFVYPSLYEGFGLPPLEAMACGTPVITSAVSSIPEVVGDAAILVDPTRVQEIAAAMYQVATDPNLRAELVQKGLERVRHFSWERAARETLKVYEQVCG